MGVDRIGSAALAADMAAMQHEEMDVRIFKT
jgi:urease accessory protein UreF